MNQCGACEQDFTSLEAFDTHRVGAHAYTDAEHSSLPPRFRDNREPWPWPPGRRCLTVDELVADGFTQDERGRWYIVESRERARAAFAHLRPSTTDRRE